MILPTALVERWPSHEYQQQHLTIESALKHNVADAWSLYKDMKFLKDIEKFGLKINEDFLNKEGKGWYKRMGDSAYDKVIIGKIIAKNDRLERLVKNSDYPAMIMAAYPEAKFLDKSRFWENADTVTGPLLLRGISSGKIIHHCHAKKQDYYFIETGYLGNYPCANNRTGRKIYHRIVKNAMHQPKIMDVPGDRWERLVEFNPQMTYRGWRRGGSKILVVVPSEKPFQHYGEKRDEWLAYVLDTLKQHTDREIVIRTKASRGERTNNTIYDALDQDIYALVTYNSIAAVEAIQYGVPAFALAPTAAAPVCSNDLSRIENPVQPHRDIVQKWLWSIAYSQFSLDEILNGDAWRMVLENDERPTFDYKELS